MTLATQRVHSSYSEPGGAWSQNPFGDAIKPPSMIQSMALRSAIRDCAHKLAKDGVADVGDLVTTGQKAGIKLEMLPASADLCQLEAKRVIPLLNELSERLLFPTGELLVITPDFRIFHGRFNPDTMEQNRFVGTRSVWYAPIVWDQDSLKCPGGSFSNKAFVDIEGTTSLANRIYQKLSSPNPGKVTPFGLELGELFISGRVSQTDFSSAIVVPYHRASMIEDAKTCLALEILKGSKLTTDDIIENIPQLVKRDGPVDAILEPRNGRDPEISRAMRTVAFYTRSFLQATIALMEQHMSAGNPDLAYATLLFTFHEREEMYSCAHEKADTNIVLAHEWNILIAGLNASGIQSPSDIQRKANSHNLTKEEFTDIFLRFVLHSSYLSELEIKRHCAKALGI